MNVPTTVTLATLVAWTTGCVSPVFVPGEPTAGQPSTTEPRGTSGGAPAPALPAAALRDAILDAVNAARRDNGAGPLEDEARLAQAAMDYAAELARTRRLSHESDTPNRRTLAERLAAAGMTDWSLIGENLAMTSDVGSILAQRVVQLWLDSPGHRSNMLHADFTLSGTGVAHTSDGIWYVTQVYARPMSRAR